jgi:hypothetical protein
MDSELETLRQELLDERHTDGGQYRHLFLLIELEIYSPNA